MTKIDGMQRVAVDAVAGSVHFFLPLSFFLTIGLVPSHRSAVRELRCIFRWLLLRSAKSFVQRGTFPSPHGISSAGSILVCCHAAHKLLANLRNLHYPKERPCIKRIRGEGSAMLLRRFSVVRIFRVDV